MIELLLHRETPSQNSRERMHWRKQRAEVKHWLALFNYTLVGKRDKATTKRHVVIHAYRKQRCHDEGNFVGGCKGMIDGMVRAGLLVDDSREWATFEYHEHKASESPTKKPCTMLTITDTGSNPPVSR